MPVNLARLISRGSPRQGIGFDPHRSSCGDLAAFRPGGRYDAQAMTPKTPFATERTRRQIVTGLMVMVLVIALGLAYLMVRART